MWVMKHWDKLPFIAAEAYFALFACEEKKCLKAPGNSSHGKV